MLKKLKRLSALLFGLLFVSLIFVSCYIIGSEDAKKESYGESSQDENLNTTIDNSNMTKDSYYYEDCDANFWDYNQCSGHSDEGTTADYNYRNCAWSGYYMDGNNSCRDNQCDKYKVTKHTYKYTGCSSEGDKITLCTEKNEEFIGRVVYETECTQVIFITPCLIPGQNTSCCN